MAELTGLPAVVPPSIPSSSTSRTSPPPPPAMTSSKKQRLDPDQQHIADPSKPLQLQRRRVWRACESCRRKKIKCDGREPTCSQCSTGGNQCTWIQTKDRAALSRHYVQELEARLIHMESLLTQVAPTGVLPDGTQVATMGSSSTSPNGPLSHSPHTDDDTLHEEADAGLGPGCGMKAAVKREELDSAMSDQFGQLALDGHGHLRWIGGSSTMSLIEAFRNATTPPPERPLRATHAESHAPNVTVNMLYFPAGLNFGRVHALPGADEVEYPERDLADLLVDAYFARFHFLLPVLDKPSFLAKYKKLMDANGEGAEAGFVSVVFAVFACAVRLVDDPRLKEGDSNEATGIIFYERAMILHYIGHTYTQLAHVQCFVLLSSFLASLNCLPQAWLLVGQAVRTAQDLGLHRSPRHLILTAIDKETRRKVWWCVYGLDRMLAVALGRPIGIEDTDNDAELPLDIDDDDLPTYFAGGTIDRSSPSLMQGFICLTSLYKIAGKVLRSVYSIDKCRDNLNPDQIAELQTSVDKLDVQLTNWCNDLPASFKSNPGSAKEVSMGAILCTSYYAVLITLHRNFLPTRRQAAPSSGSTSVAKAVCASRSCIFLAPSIKDVIPPSHHLAFFIQYLFSSAVIILLVVMHATDDSAAKTAMDEVASCLKALEALEGSWPGAKKCKELLSDLAHATRESLAKATAERAAKAAVAPISTSNGSGSGPGSGTHSPLHSPIEPSMRGTGPPAPKRARSRSGKVSPRESFQFQTPGQSYSPPHQSGSNKRARDNQDEDNGRRSSISFHNTFPTAFSSSSGGSSSNEMPTSVAPANLMELPRRRDSFTGNNHSTTQTPSPELNDSHQYAYNPPQPLPYNVPSNWATPRSGSSAASADINMNGGDGSSSLFPQLNSHYGSNNGGHGVDNFLPYLGASFEAASPLQPQSSLPGSSTFDLTGLPPFAGMDFIQNFTATGYNMASGLGGLNGLGGVGGASLGLGGASGGGHMVSTPGGSAADQGMDALWQSLGTTFRYGPDVQFGLGDGIVAERGER